ncbi:MAG: acetate/propionate family kinase, partial [Anaerolineales bacterium]
MKVLVPNLGSTSLKYQLLEMEGERVLARGKIERIGSAQAQLSFSDAAGRNDQASASIKDHRAAIQRLIDRLAQFEGGGAAAKAIDAVGFKAIHGGPRYRGSFPVTEDVLGAMRDFLPVAPVHNSIYLQAIEIFGELLPGVPMVAVFETGFHATIPEHAGAYGVPYEWREKYGVRRYGFHGSSHRYVSGRVPEMLGRSAQGLRLASCHLGGSSSICAVRDGKSVDASFGFSAQSGIEHATRPGDLDPYVLLYIMEKEKLTAAQIGELLCKQGGLLGISGVGGDLRDLEEAAATGNARAVLAIEVLVHEVKKYIGAFAAAMGGLDGVAFTGGIGENAWRVRQEICRDMEFLGLRLDEERNRAPGTSDRIISALDSRVAVLV